MSLLCLLSPALNLGTPKQAGNATSVAPSSLPNSKLSPAVMSSSAAAAFMADMLTYPAPSLSAFPLKSVPYMATPLSVSSALKGPPVPNTSLAKPTPISMGAKVPITRVVSGGMEREASQPAFSCGGSASGKVSKPPVSKLLSSSENVTCGVVKEEGGLPGQSYYPQPPLVNSPSNSISKMLLAPSSPAHDPEQQEQQPPADGTYAACVTVYALGYSTFVKPRLNCCSNCY